MSRNREIFKPLHAKFSKSGIGLPDIMELIGNFCEHQPLVGRAMAFHMRDYLLEVKKTPDWGTVVSELYWRTFFSPEHAPLYGTTDMLDSGEEMMTQFVSFMVNAQIEQAVAQQTLFAEPTTAQ